MKRGRLPLTALRSFEAAGRLLSFTAAATELHVSQAAISRQVRELETIIGKSLFVRHHRAVSLTPEGARLLSVLTEGFDSFDAALGQLMTMPGQGRVTISCEPTFAATWLVPRLAEFRNLHPGIEIIMDTDQRLADFRASGIDLAIRFSARASEWPRTESEPLHRETLTAMMSPATIRERGLPASPAELLGHTLLYEDRDTPWAAWFAAAGLTGAAVPEGPVLSDGGLTMQATLRGHGVMLANPLILAGDLENGLLVQPFPVNIRYGRYHLVTRSFASLGPAARLFADWLTAAIDAAGLTAD